MNISKSIWYVTVTISQGELKKNCVLFPELMSVISKQQPPLADSDSKNDIHAQHSHSQNKYKIKINVKLTSKMH